MSNPLGFIRKADRSKQQEQAHEAALHKMVKFSLPCPQLAKGDKVALFDAWNDPAVVQEVGFKFDRIHQLTGSCFPAGTPVRMDDGTEKAIEAVVVGDRVVTHKGRCRPVSHVMERKYTGEMVMLHVKGFPFPLEMTADHQVAIRDGDDILWKCAEDIAAGDEVLIGWDSERLHQVDFFDTAELLGDDVVLLDELMKDSAFTKGNEPEVPNSNICSARTVVRQSGVDWKGKVRLRRSRIENAINRYVPVCPSLGRLVGLYLAEGGVHEGRVVFTFHRKETDTLAAEVLALVKGLFGVDGEIILNEDKPNTCTLRFANVNLAAVLTSLVPGNVYTKRVPAALFTADDATRLAVFMGWFAGDGHVGLTKRKQDVRLTGVTCCASLARDMTTLALSCGLRAATQKRKARKQSREAYSVNLTGKKAVSLFPSVAYRANGQGYDKPDNGVCNSAYARPVSRIEYRQVINLPVFDFEVQEDHSFVAGGLVVHNCVWAGGTNAVFSTIAMQRVSATNPTKAFLPFTLHNYALSRHYMGDDGQGEGSLGSTFAKSLTEDGIRDWTTTDGLPKWSDSDGVSITASDEMKWSSYRNPQVAKVREVSKDHLFGSAAECRTTQDIKAMNLNGYGVTFACDRYIGNARVVGSGADACVVGYWDSNGGHQQSIHAYWEHPTLGPLFWVQNNWPASVYPKDPAGGPTCGCWVTEANVQRALSYDAEVYGLSHLQWFPASAPQVIDWSLI